MERLVPVSHEKIRDEYKKCLTNVASGKGGLMVLSGESGFGKTFILKEIEEEATKRGIMAVYTQALNPIGKVKVGNMQPLLPFSKAIEGLISLMQVSAQKKFAVNLGMTVLASIPVAGDVFYAIKEIGRDWRQFKKDKSSDNTRKVSSASADYYDAINAYCDSMPIVMLMDDMHWADSQTIELLTLLVENILNIQLLIVCTYKNSVLETSALAMQSFLNNPMLKQIAAVSQDISPFGIAEIKELSKPLFKQSTSSDSFAQWLLEHSYGVPSVVAEYLAYFKRNNPFDANGNFNINDDGAHFLPASMQSLMASAIENLDEDEKNILAVCSAEGSEFTVSLAAKLLNIDILTAIKKLRAIQNKTNIIRSIGAHNRYGEKTTVYKFTQAFYHSFFEKTLEFEEYVALHGEVANLLKEKYNATGLQEIKDQIAPYLAAHSSEAGDDETAESMLMLSAESSKKYGNPETVKSIYNDFLAYQEARRTPSDSDQEDSKEQELIGMIQDTYHDFAREQRVQTMPVVENDGGDGPSPFDQFHFHATYNEMMEDFVDNKLDEVKDRIDHVLSTYKQAISDSEKIKLIALKARAMVDSAMLTEALDLLNDYFFEVKNSNEFEAQCLFYNSFAIAEGKKGNIESAKEFLNLAAETSVGLSPEYKLMTIANIAQIFKERNIPGTAKYMSAAKRLAEDMNLGKVLEEME